MNWKDTNAFSHEKCGKMEEFRMKMKKMLAILAALSVLGTTGLTVGAEDALDALLHHSADTTEK